MGEVEEAEEAEEAKEAKEAEEAKVATTAPGNDNIRQTKNNRSPTFARSAQAPIFNSVERILFRFASLPVRKFPLTDKNSGCSSSCNVKQKNKATYVFPATSRHRPSPCHSFLCVFGPVGEVALDLALILELEIHEAA